MFKIEHLSKKFLDQCIFEDVSITFPCSGLVGIIGASGEGKSTLLNLLAMLDVEYQGTICYKEENYSKVKDKEQFRFQHFGFVFQNNSLFPLLSVIDNILLHQKKDVENITKCKQVLKKVGLDIALDKKVQSLSGGEQQRIAIARALMMNPDVLFCDEPTGALDAKNKRNIMKLLQEISKECLVIVVSHEVKLIEEVANTIYEIKNRKISIIKQEGKEAYKIKKEEKENRLTIQYMLHYIYAHLKQKKYRSIIAIFALSIGFVAIGLSFVMTEIVGNSIKDSLYSLMDNKNMLMKSMEDENNVIEKYACPLGVLEDIEQEYSSQVSGIGTFYFSDFESQFPQNNEFSIIEGTYEVIFGELGSRNINEYFLLEDIEEKVYPDRPFQMKDDEVILKLREKDIERIASSLELPQKDIDSLSTYLSKKNIASKFTFKNDFWSYQDEVFLRVIGFVVSDEIGLIHSSFHWNESIFETQMHFKSSEDLVALEAIPWTFKKVYYLKTKPEQQIDLAHMLLYDEKYEDLYFDFINEENSWYLINEQYPRSGRIYVTFQNRSRISLAQVKKIDGVKIQSYFYGVPQSYYIIDALMMHGFTHCTFVSTSQKNIDKLNDEYTFYEKNLDTTLLSSIDENISYGGIAGISQKQNLKFQSQRNQKYLKGREADSLDEIVISSALARHLFPGKSFESILNKDLYFLMVKNVIDLDTYYQHQFEDTVLSIVGIIDEENVECLYHQPEWVILFYADKIHYSLSDLSVKEVFFYTEYESVNESILKEYQNKYPSFQFSNPALSFLQSMEDILVYIRYGFIAFSVIAILSSILMTILVLYLFIVENRREIGLLKALGFRMKSIMQLFILFSLILGLVGLIHSSITLGIVGLFISKTIFGGFSGFPLISYLEGILLVSLVMIIICVLVGYFCSRQALKYDPLVVLKEK